MKLSKCVPYVLSELHFHRPPMILGERGLMRWLETHEDEVAYEIRLGQMLGLSSSCFEYQLRLSCCG